MHRVYGAGQRRLTPNPGRMTLPTRTASVAIAASLIALVLQGSAAAQPAADKIWVPKQGVSWQWQLSGKIDTTCQGARSTTSTCRCGARRCRTLHAKGRKVICYISAGSFENCRSGRRRSSRRRSSGKTLDGWPGERWLDIRQIAMLAPDHGRQRMDRCRAKGFDGVEPDNVDGYTNDTGFPLTGAQQRAYNKMLAGAGPRARVSRSALKNDVDQVKALQPVLRLRRQRAVQAISRVRQLSAVPARRQGGASTRSTT